MKDLRVIFFGTPEFVLPVVKFLHEQEELLGVVTQPDKPKGRGLEVSPSPVKKWALNQGLRIWEPIKLRDPHFLEELKALSLDLIVVFAYGKILPKELLEIPQGGCWNIHLSLLPKYRGASPVQWALLEGERETGVTIMLMDEGMDTGPILLQRAIPIEEEDTTPTLLEKLSHLAVTTLGEALELYKKGELKAKPQPERGVSYAPLLKKEDGFINFEEPALRIENKLRAFTPWPGVYTKFRGKILKIHEAKAQPLSVQKRPGEILKLSPEGILVATSDGALLLKTLQLEGKKRISAYEFAHGQRLKPGDLLIS